MIKKAIKSIIGPENIKKIKSYIKYYLNIKSKKKRLLILCDSIEDVYTIENPKGHVFCGYFDINPDNPQNKDEILVGMLKKNAKNGKDSLTIGIANYKKNIIEPIIKTKAWNWQMGSRLRWSKKNNCICYNDFKDGEYCCNIYNIKDKKIINSIPYALYDIGTNEEIGLTVNFDRLQRLRPGYGYSNRDDITKDDNAPSDDGLFLVDLKTGKRKLIVSLEQLSNLLPESSNKQCYINHVSISPDSEKAMFFFIWQIDQLPGWNATMWIINLKTKELKCIEKDDQVSHYDWRDNDNLVITGITKYDKKGFYRIYNCKTGKYSLIKDNSLNKDGHPVFSRLFEGFYSDTYPDKENYQTFFAYKNNAYIPLIKLFHDPRMFGEKRCDLHPHYFKTDEVIALDTTYIKNRRHILIVRMKNEFKK